MRGVYKDDLAWILLQNVRMLIQAYTAAFLSLRVQPVSRSEWAQFLLWGVGQECLVMTCSFFLLRLF